MKQFIAAFFLLLTFSIAEAQRTRNSLVLRGNTPEESVIVPVSGMLSSADQVRFTDKGVAFSMTGSLNGTEYIMEVEVPVKTGQYQIKVDKDGDLKNEEKFVITVKGKNHPVDTKVYEVSDPMDVAVINTTKADKDTRHLEGTITARLFDGATGIKKISASCMFDIHY